MAMARAAGELLAPLRHEARHDAEARADLLGGGLEQDAAVGRFERLGEHDGDLVHARPRLRVQAFDRHAECGEILEQRLQILARMIGAEQRIAEHAGRHGRGIDALLGSPGLRCLGEVEELELEPAHRLQRELLGALQHPLQHLPSVERKRLFTPVDHLHEVAEEEIHAVVPGHLAMRAEVEARQRIGKALVPARERGVVVALVVQVPAVHDIAEAEPALDHRRELVLVDVLAAQDAVDVGDGDLDALPG